MNTYATKLEKNSNLSKKREIRDFLVTKYPKYCKKIVGLAGPDINSYIDWCYSNGFKDITIYEKDVEVFHKQLQTVKKPVKLVFGDISEVKPDTNKVFYDLDYCSTIIKAKNNLKQFQNNYTLTMSLRPIGGEETIKQFFEEIKETPYQMNEFTKPVNHMIFTTVEGNKYLYVNYFDSSPMCCISKIN